MNLTSAILGMVAPGLPGDTLTLTGNGTLGMFGTVTLAGGHLTYAATGDVLKRIPANGSQADSFTYTVADQYGDTATGTADVTVNNPAVVIGGPPHGSGTIVAGAGQDRVVAGGGNDSVTLPGHRYQALGAGTVNGGIGDIIRMANTDLTLIGGTREMVLLGPGTASLDDLSCATTVVVGRDSGSASIMDVARDARFVLELTGHVGDFRTTAQVVDALQSDGHGGTQLLLGNGTGAAVIDFVNARARVLTAEHFRIG